MILEDFTMLGTTVPEPAKTDGRISVCSAGVSPEAGGLIRIYPLARHHAPRRWDTFRVPVERNPKDARPESFKLKGDRSETGHPHINEVFNRVGNVRPADRHELLKKYVVPSIDIANDRRLSLAVLHPDIGEIEFEENAESPDSPLLTLFDMNPRPVAGAKRFPLIPRLHFKDDGGAHRLMIRDWGCYEWMRKHPDRVHEMPSCLHLTDQSSLLIGNINRFKKSWLIISVLNGIRDGEPTLFDPAPGDQQVQPTTHRKKPK